MTPSDDLGRTLKVVVVEYFKVVSYNLLTPVAARSKARVCGRSLTGLGGSNPAAGLDVCFLLCVVCC